MTKQSARKKGLSEAIILKSLEIVEKEDLGPIRISAQSYLENIILNLALLNAVTNI